MSYTILNVAYPFAPVRPDTAGGAEQVVLMLDSGIAEAGHASAVVACDGSVCKGAVFETVRPAGSIDAAVRSIVWERHRDSISRALRERHIDLIHMHGIDFYAYLPRRGTPILVTLHLPIGWYSPAVFESRRGGVFFNCVSISQQRDCPSLQTLVPYIENGVPVDFFSACAAPKRDYALCMGRICPEKGYHRAIDAARRAGIALILAGGVFGYASHQEYFAREIAPRIDGKNVCFTGPVGPVEKRELLSAARCLLVPSLVPETSSLAAMEALACGTPVIAFPSGALTSIVEQGKTGFLVHDEAEMAGAIRRSPSIDGGACRAAARARFSDRVMVGGYLETYRAIITGAAACVPK